MNKLIRQVNIADVQGKSDALSKYDPNSVCFGRIRDILVSGILAARSMPEIQEDIRRLASVEIPLDKLDIILDKYVAGIKEKEDSLKDRLRWEQNQRTVLMISKVMNLIEQAQNSEDGMSPRLLKEAVLMLERLHTRQAKLFGLDLENRPAAGDGGQTQVVVNFNMSGFDPSKAGYPPPPESVTVDAEFTECEKDG